MALPHEENLSDDDFYFGQLSLKEIKKHILWDKTRPATKCSLKPTAEDNYKSFKLIETHSEPNLIHERVTPGLSSSKSTNLDMRTSDDSFIKLENMVEELCKSPDKTECKVELNNTLDVIDYILSHGPPDKKNDVKNKEIKIEHELCISNKDEKVEDELSNEKVLKNKGIKVEQCISNKDETVEDELSNKNVLNNKGIKVEESISNKDEKVDDDLSINNVLNNKGIKVEDKLSLARYPSPIKVENINEPISSCHFLTPAKIDNKGQQNNYSMTPRSAKTPKPKMQVLKTPGPSSSQKKPSTTSLKVSASKSNAYKHIASPVAYYIKKTPQVPLMKNVYSKKPLPSSSIPKYLWNSTKKKTSYTENVNLPSVAYRSAKETKVIDIPDEEKLPKCQWVKKITTTLPKPVVIKHDHREVNFIRKPLMPQQEDSFADLSYHQADLSVCTKKSAFKLKKHL